MHLRKQLAHLMADDIVSLFIQLIAVMLHGPQNIWDTGSLLFTLVKCTDFCLL